VPEGRKIFAGLTVKENLIAGAYLTKDKEQIKSDIDRMYQMFPRLKEREKQQGGTLSGGEQQMLAIARGLMSHPKLLLLDEPSLGLAPSIVKEVFKTIEMIKADGMTILLVEQNAKKALSICDYAYVLRNGKVVMEGSGKDLINDEEVQKIYLGGRQEDLL
jgi:branched-chain amino acid transport system ATP-binding protein